MTKHTIFIFKNIILFFILSFTFISCSTKENKINTLSLPSWFIKPTYQDNKNFYAISSSYSIEEAKKQALNNISSYLSIEIKSSTNIQKNTSLGFYEKNVSQNINTYTKKLQFINAEIIKNEIIDSKFYVLVEVNKNKLFNENKNILDNSDRYINKKIEENKNLSILEQIKNLTLLENTLKDSQDKAYILYAINNSFNYKKYISKYQKLLNKKESLIGKIIIKVNNNSSKDNLFKNELINLFNDNSYKISKNNFNVISEISTQINYSKYRDWFISKTLTNIKIYSNNKIIASHTIKANGQSSSSPENANVSASLNFKKKIRKIGINKILFSE